MDDFDRLLEHHLRRKLDAVVAAPVPVRRRSPNQLKKDGRAEPAARSFGVIPIDMRTDAFVFVEHL